MIVYQGTNTSFRRDVINGLISSKLDLDEDEIVNAKMEQNERKYPVSKAKKKANKYNKL